MPEIGALPTMVPAAEMPVHVDGMPVFGVADDTLSPRGFEPIADFEEAVAAEAGRLEGKDAALRADPSLYDFDHQHHAYTARGRYTDFLEPLAEQVGRDRVLVLDSGEFFSRPEDAFERVLRFLGLPWIGEFAFARHNARGRPSPMSAALREQTGAARGQSAAQ